MKVNTKNAHPKGKGRSVRTEYNVTSIGATASGGAQLPDDTECVSIGAHAYDGEDSSVSTQLFITLGLDEDPNKLDALIVKLTDLRAHQRRLKGL